MKELKKLILTILNIKSQKGDINIDVMAVRIYNLCDKIRHEIKDSEQKKLLKKCYEAGSVSKGGFQSYDISFEDWYNDNFN